MKSRRVSIIILSLLVLASMLLAACGAAPASGKVKVGLSFSDFATERWKNEEVLMRKLLEEKGYEVLSQEANHDVKLQNDQIDTMVAQGVKGLIVIAEDGAAAATSVDKAAAAGVKVIAYDRLIKTKNIAAYLSFDNVEVGRQQALGVMTALAFPEAPPGQRTTPQRSFSPAGLRPTTTRFWSARARWKLFSRTSTKASSRSWRTSGWTTGMPATPRR
jgi:ABC-type xylose transport system substrate-binding protein